MDHFKGRKDNAKTFETDMGKKLPMMMMMLMVAPWGFL